MSLKAELEVWASALEAYDAERFDDAIELFSVSTRAFLCGGLIDATPWNVED